MEKKWKKSVTTFILIPILVIEVIVLLYHYQQKLEEQAWLPVLTIEEAELLKEEGDTAYYKVVINNDGSKDASRLPGLFLIDGERRYFIEAVNIYQELIEESDYALLGSGIPGKTKVEAIYKLDYDYKEIKDSKSIAFEVPEYATMKQTTYILEE